MIGKTNAISQSGIKPEGTIDISSNGQVDVSNYATANVNVPDYLLEKLQGTLSSYTVPDTVNEIPSYAFTNLPVLESVYFQGNVTKIGSEAFSYCSSLKNIVIPDSVTTIGKSAFQSCNSLTNIEIPGSVTSISSSAFLWAGLNSITFNPGLISIGNYCFQGTLLTEVVFPPTLEKTGMASFSGCPLKKVYIPKSLTLPDQSMFDNCKNLEEVTLENGFNGNKLNLSASTLYTAETIVSWLEALADRTELSAYKLTIGATNLAKLTEEQIAIATAKNWTLA